MAWQHPVDILVTVDHDAETAAMQSQTGRYRGPSYLSVGGFGARAGMTRLLETLALRDIPATFFVPGSVAERWPASVEAVLDTGHEVALHGYLHEYVTAMTDPAEERMVLERGLHALQAVTAAEITGYRPPGSLYSGATVELLEEFGFRYGSAMQDDDGAYVHAGDPARALVEIPCHWHLADDLFGWNADIRMTPSQVEETWLAELEALGRYPDRLFVLTLHPHQIGHPGRLAMLERVLDRAAELGARFRTCDQVATAVRASALARSERLSP